MSNWPLRLHFTFILLGSLSITDSSLHNYLQFPRRHNEKSEIGPTHTSSLYNVHLHNISVDQAKMCTETCTGHICSAVELIRTSLCSTKHSIENEFRSTNAASRNMWGLTTSTVEHPTIFDVTIFKKLEDVLGKAFVVTYALQQKDRNQSVTLDKRFRMDITADSSISAAQPIQDTWIDQINVEVQKIQNAEDEARFYAEGGAADLSDEELTKQLYHKTKIEIEGKIINASLKSDKSSREDITETTSGNLSDEIALEAIRALLLKDYRILHDAKQDFHVSEIQRRTRSHVGVVDGDMANDSILQHAYRDLDKRDVDSSMLFWYNLKAVAALAKRTDEMIHLNQILCLFPVVNKSTSMILNASEFHITLAQNGVKSLAQSTAEAASLDANVSMKVIESTAHAAKHSFRMRKRYRKDLWRSLVLTEQDDSTSRISSMQNAMESERENEKLDTDSNIDVAIDAITLIGKILSLRNQTARELLRLGEAAKSEAILERTKVEYEAQEERENEASTLKRVQAMGEAATKEVIEIIQIVFQNLAQGFVHICYTQHGRSQFLLFALAAALLAFSLVLSKELVSLFLSTLQIMARTPNIVREYGNLNYMSRRRSLRAAASSKPILPPGIERRLENICKANIKAYKRGAPMRHLLLSGKSGTGKSLVATTMARCMINLPYAVMSGADIAPLGRLGPLELRRLLTWANNRPKGAVIIIDEAESALGSRIRERSRSGIEPGFIAGDKNDVNGESDGIGYARDSLNVLLSLTGCTDTKFMLIITTSHPEKLDEAVLDRMDDMIELPLPAEEERLRLLRVEFNKRFSSSSNLHPSCSKRSVGQIAYEANFDPEKELELLSSNGMTYNFSGREIKKVLQAVASSVYSKETSILNKEDWDEITQDICKSLAAKK